MPPKTKATKIATIGTTIDWLRTKKPKSFSFLDSVIVNWFLPSLRMKVGRNKIASH